MTTNDYRCSRSASCSLLCHGVAVVSLRGVVESCSLLAKWVGMKGEGTCLCVIMKKTTTNDDNVVVVHCLVTTLLPVTWHLGPIFVVVVWSWSIVVVRRVRGGGHG
jgi:hypothetical protein